MNLTDVNENGPIFIDIGSSGKIQAAVPENRPGPVPVYNVFAIDLDGTYPNNNVSLVY